MWIDYESKDQKKVKERNGESNLRIMWPSESKINASEDLPRRRTNVELLRGMFTIMDGSRMPCAAYSDTDTQNALFNGYECEVEVTNLFSFNFDDCLIHAGFNYPSSWHDSRIENE